MLQISFAESFSTVMSNFSIILASQILLRQGGLAVAYRCQHCRRWFWLSSEFSSYSKRNCYDPVSSNKNL